MDPLRAPPVVAAKAELEAARKALEAKETAFLLALYAACGSVPATAEALEQSPRTVLRRLKAAGVRGRDIKGAK